MNLPDGKRGQLVAIALLLIPVILLVNFVFGPLFGAYAEIKTDIEALHQDIARYRRVIDQLPALQAAADRAQRSQPLAPFLLPGTTAELAAANLQRRLQTVAKENSARIVSVRVQPPVDDGPLQRVSVKARLQSGTRALRDSLHALETRTPFVFVDSLSINKRRARRGDNTPDALDIIVTFSGLRAPNMQSQGEPGNG